MDHSISPPGDSILWGKAQVLNEKTVAGVGFLVFLMVVAGSIVIRLSLEVNARQKVDSARTGVDDHLGVEPGIVPNPSLPNFCRFPDMAPRSRWKPAWLLGVADQIEM